MSAANPLFTSLTAPSPHPDTEALRQYAAGTLTPADEQRIEAHTLDCERCADILEGLSMSDTATTDHAVAELRARLQTRIGQGERVPVVPVSQSRLWYRLAAAAAVAGLAAGSFWGWERLAPPPPSVASTATEVTPATPAPGTSESGANAPIEAPTAADVAVAPAATPPPATSSPAPASGALASRKASKSATYAATVVAADAEAPASLSATSGAPPAETFPDVAMNTAPIEAEKSAQETQSDRKAEEAKDEATVTVAPAKAMAAPEMMAKRKMAEPPSGAAGRAAAMPAAPTLAPVPAGGVAALHEYLRHKASEFDPELNALRLSGSVRVRLTVGEDGKITQAKVTRSLRADYDAEALRIVCDGPAWQPGIAGGRRAALPVDVVVPF